MIKFQTRKRIRAEWDKDRESLVRIYNEIVRDKSATAERASTLKTTLAKTQTDLAVVIAERDFYRAQVHSVAEWFMDRPHLISEGGAIDNALHYLAVFHDECLPRLQDTAREPLDRVGSNAYRVQQ